MILIVDDEAPVRSMLLALLEDEGYQVVEATNGLEAIERLKRQTERFRLVLLDIMMPYKDGWDVLDELRRDPILATLPVVVLTAGENVQRQAFQHGASAYLSKPFDIRALLQIVEHYLH
jgi:CheY-like chemotaxis protein